MKQYNPGASINNNFAYGCDNCERWGVSLVIWKDLSDKRDHFALCHKCLGALYLEHIAMIDKKDEILVVRRNSISEDIRNEIYERDDYKCQDCGSSSSLTLDHIIPFSKGGTTEKSNLRTLCQSCNSKKKDRID